VLQRCPLKSGTGGGTRQSDFQACCFMDAVDMCGIHGISHVADQNCTAVADGVPAGDDIHLQRLEPRRLPLIMDVIFFLAEFIVLCEGSLAIALTEELEDMSMMVSLPGMSDQLSRSIRLIYSQYFTHLARIPTLDCLTMINPDGSYSHWLL
jgi:hypothetical protein